MNIVIRVKGPNRKKIVVELNAFFSEIYGADISWKELPVEAQGSTKSESLMSWLPVILALPISLNATLSLIERAKHRKSTKDVIKRVQKIMTDPEDAALIEFETGAVIDMSNVSTTKFYDELFQNI